MQRKYDKSHQYYEESLKISRSEKYRDLREESRTLQEIGNIYRDENNIEMACINYEMSLNIKHQDGSERGLLFLFEDIAGLSVRYGYYEDAARLYGLSHTTRPLPHHKECA